MEREVIEEVKHECVYNQIVIESKIRYLYGELDFKVNSILVSLDCECEESRPKIIVEFCDSEILSASDMFKGWFASVVDYFIQKDYRIIDRRI